VPLLSLSPRIICATIASAPRNPAGTALNPMSWPRPQEVLSCAARLAGNRLLQTLVLVRPPRAMASGRTADPGMGDVETSPRAVSEFMALKEDGGPPIRQEAAAGGLGLDGDDRPQHGGIDADILCRGGQTVAVQGQGCSDKPHETSTRLSLRVYSLTARDIWQERDGGSATCDDAGGPLRRFPDARSGRRNVGLPAGSPKYVRTRMATPLPLRPRCRFRSGRIECAFARRRGESQVRSRSVRAV
jgi:hypothetical protein